MMSNNQNTAAAKNKSLKLLSGSEAYELDQKLFNDYKFSVEALMELAGLSVAEAVRRSYGQNQKILVLCGPGNNGGDGLVAARHLKLFGHEPIVYYPKRTDKTLYRNLLATCEAMDVQIYDPQKESWEIGTIKNKIKPNVILDALFGFSFKPPIRSNFLPLLQDVVESQNDIPVVSVDIPSGWNVDTGESEIDLKPDCLISLTAPKLCSKFFVGRYHYLGGRFIPPKLADHYGLNLPEYPNGDGVLRLS